MSVKEEDTKKSEDQQSEYAHDSLVKSDQHLQREFALGFADDVVDHLLRQQVLNSDNPIDLLSDIFAQQGLSSEFIRMVMGYGAGQFEDGDVEGGLISALHQFLQFDAVAPTGGAVAMVGPPGSGKSLATLRFVDHLKRVFHYRVAIVEIVSEEGAESVHLNRWARLLGVPIVQIDWCWGVFVPLREQLERLQDADIVVVDTPGFSAEAPEKIRALCGDLNMINEVERMLVLPANTQATLASNELASWFVPGFERMLVTGIDRSGLSGGVFDLAYHRDKALSYFTFGDSLPGGIEPASADQVLRLLMRQFH